jgi:ABC-type Zn uptake system ZnuABC Zn-binding protein ZnuA
MADMAKNIGGDFIEVKSIVPIGGDPHIYDATPEDAKLAETADLVLVNGLTFEGWLSELIENSGSEAPVHTITNGIDAIASLTYQNATDPHAWMDPILGQIYIKNILSALIELLPQYEEELVFNYNVYKQQIEDLHIYCTQRIAEIPESQRILITSHDAFQYYGRRYGLRLEAIMGTSTDAEVQTSDIRRISDIISERQIPAVFIESTINPKLLQQIADDNGAVVGGQLYSDSLSDENGPAPTYIKMLEHNTNVIVNALIKPRIISEEETSTSISFYILLCLSIIAVLFFSVRMLNNNQ